MPKQSYKKCYILHEGSRTNGPCRMAATELCMLVHNSSEHGKIRHGLALSPESINVRRWLSRG